MFTTELQYIVIRYMLNELADEAANVGIVAVADDPPQMLYKFIEDPATKSRHDVRVRKEIVDRFESFIAKRKQEFDANAKGTSKAALFDQVREFSAGVMRTNMTRSVLTNDIEKDFNLLFQQWISPIRAAASHHASTGPRDPLGGLKKKASSAVVRAFREGYGTLKRETFHRRYEVAGAVHKNIVDLAMVGRVGNKECERLFHHVLVLPDAEESFTQAAGLCCRWEDIKETNHVDRNLTAVLYERVGTLGKGLSDATQLLKKAEIEVTRIKELPGLAQRLKGQRLLPL